jgi:hypothetical protein
MFRPSKEMIVRDLQEALWQTIEPRIDSPSPHADSHKETMRQAIQRFVEERAACLSMAELADALDSLEHTATSILEDLRLRGIAGDPVA